MLRADLERTCHFVGSTGPVASSRLPSLLPRHVDRAYLPCRRTFPVELCAAGGDVTAGKAAAGKSADGKTAAGKAAAGKAADGGGGGSALSWVHERRPELNP